MTILAAGLVAGTGAAPKRPAVDARARAAARTGRPLSGRAYSRGRRPVQQAYKDFFM